MATTLVILLDDLLLISPFSGWCVHLQRLADQALEPGRLQDHAA